ncbi:unnamed protein product [Boreogadus saida]
MPRFRHTGCGPRLRVLHLETARGRTTVHIGSEPPVGPISLAVCAVEPDFSDPLPVASVTIPMTYVPQAAPAQSRRLEGGASPPPTVREICIKNREALDDQQQERLW